MIPFQYAIKLQRFVESGNSSGGVGIVVNPASR